MQRKQWLVRWLAMGLCLTTAYTSTAQTPGTSGVVPQALRISILEGEGALNNIRQRTAREPIVQVKDKNNKPVAGATVLFLLPDSGPGGAFANGAQTLTVLTDQKGQAKATGFRPNGQTGAFLIKVIATFAGLSAEATIRQVNIGAPEEQTTKVAKHGGHGIAPKWIVIGAVVVAGSAAGIAGAVRSGGSKSTITITPGSTTVGPPK